VAGEWSLVDVFERDGKRFVIARENAPDAPPAERLSARERAVAAYTALGHSQKHIGYTLGLAPATVSFHLTAARRKLGVASNVQLVAALGWGALFGAGPTR